MEKLT